jgi:hypothetical protein
MPPIFNDIAEFITLMASFSQVVILRYLPLHIIVSQTVIAASQRCHFTLGSPRPIVADRGFPLRVTDRSLRYDEVCCLSPLMCQCNKGRAFRWHALDRLHDSMKPHDIEIQIQILDHSILGRPGVECL